MSEAAVQPTPSQTTDVALSMQGLRKDFGGVVAVHDLHLDIPEGSIFGIMGPNGAGKTTILNLVSGFLQPDTGRFLINGQDATNLPAHDVARLGVARTYQNVRLFPGMSVLDTVVAGFYQHRSSTFLDTILSLSRDRRERKQYHEEALAILERVGVSADPEQLGETLPYGEQRRLEIARALAARPRLLLLDEPTAGMNATESAELGDLFRSLRDDGVTIALIEHNIRLVLEYCEAAAVIDFGRLIAEGTPRECVDKREVQEAYFGKQSDAERVESLLKLRRDQGSS
jgi:branched-chain amino acid transport system ATP-binding protein